MQNIRILGESSDPRRKRREAWRYRVEYRELYEHLPLLTNSATAEFHVYQDTQAQVAGCICATCVG